MNREKTLGLMFLVSLMIMALAPMASAGSYADINDDCSNLTKIQVIQDLILNSTFIGFNQSGTSEGIKEDTGDYTLVNPTSSLTILNSTGVENKAGLNANDYLYKDMGVDNIDDFNVTFFVDTISHLSNGQAYAFMVGKTASWIPDVPDFIGYRVRFNNANAKYQYALVIYEGGVNTYSTAYEPVGSPNAYLRMIKKSARVWCEIYSDSARTVLVANHSTTLAADETYRYVYYANTVDVNLGAREMYIKVYNIDGLSSTGIKEGIIYSKDLLNGISENATAFLIETEISATNEMSIEFSEDNSTWVTVNGEASSGFYGWSLEGLNYSSLYVRFNFSRPGGSQLCNLDNFKVLYPSAGGGTGDPVNRWIWALMASVVMLALGALLKPGQARPT